MSAKHAASKASPIQSSIRTPSLGTARSLPAPGSHEPRPREAREPLLQVGDGDGLPLLGLGQSRQAYARLGHTKARDEQPAGEEEQPDGHEGPETSFGHGSSPLLLQGERL